MLALAVRSSNQPFDEDEDDEEYIIGRQRDGVRQPLISNRQNPQASSGVPTLEPRPIRNDAWSQRMRNKVLNYIQQISLRNSQVDQVSWQRGLFSVIEEFHWFPIFRIRIFRFIIRTNMQLAICRIFQSI